MIRSLFSMVLIDRPSEWVSAVAVVVVERIGFKIESLGAFKTLFAVDLLWSGVW